ncbi:ATPase [Nocardia nova]|uniref:ATPase n=1 Tax=Nocardia nova TaxID=37330 RepID=A0A2S6AX22_9NOCA|nr:V-type ATP synthase subunit A [Nocardia nova]PPJ34378.1 ATPase [Nocardia nova]PPJ39802.1 ATPase [Nocardia nova]
MSVVLRVSGPLVEVSGFPGMAMSHLVALGDDALPAEIVHIDEERVTVQAFEYTGGLRPGAIVAPLYAPLSVSLAPQLLGGIFDGLLRPLADAPTWLAPRGADQPATRRYRFRPAVEIGAAAGQGTVLGVLTDSGPVEYRVLVPPGVSGDVEMIVAEGDYPTDESVARVGGRPVRIAQRWPVRLARPHSGTANGAEPLLTGQRVVDLLFPVLKGGTVGVPGGFGTGKTMLLQQIAKWCDADVIVYVGCGERGNELADIIDELVTLGDPRSGGKLIERTVIIANTSNMPMMAREASVYTGVTVAEYFRDMGYHAVVVADSTSRWAEALREFASRLGALPAEEGYPADLGSALAAFYERAGAVRTLGERSGSVTIIGAVSPPGGDLSEPVTAQTERFVRCRWSLDRELAYSRHYPAVSWEASFSYDVDTVGAGYEQAGDSAWGERRGQVVALLAEADRIATLTELVGLDALPPDQRVTVLAGRLLSEGLLTQNALSANDSHCAMAKTVALADAVLTVIDRCRQAVARGVAPERVEELDFGTLVRARETTGPDDTIEVARLRDEILDRIGELT